MCFTNKSNRKRALALSFTIFFTNLGNTPVIFTAFKINHDEILSDL